MLGGVTLTFSQDMTDIDPLMTAGATLTLNGQQAEAFCRSRMGVGDQTNASRMVRQRQYLQAAGMKLLQLLRENVNHGTRILEGMGVIYDQSAADAYGFGITSAGTAVGEAQGHWLMTNALQRTIVNDMVQAAGYELLDTQTLPGVHSLDNSGYIRFTPEPGAAIEWVLKTLYRSEE